MELKDIFTYLSVPGILFVWALVEVAARTVKHDEKNKLPGWFIWIPALGGFLFAILEYFEVTPSETLKDLTLVKRILQAVIKGFGGFAIAVVVFEFRKQIWKAIQNRYFPKNNSQPPEPPQS